jgi:DNA-directed RNA polymerase sigma subunit (sigma70/sigma32)
MEYTQEQKMEKWYKILADFSIAQNNEHEIKKLYDSIFMKKNIDEQHFQEKLIHTYSQFVTERAKLYEKEIPQGITLSDLTDAGNFGLIKAAHRFDETRHYKFTSLATWWVHWAIIKKIVIKQTNVG